ncbi:MAG: hypothetical protein DRP71_17015 [Verrucomicrobia bacterium]|nr:MAG: hypothetical protein DRP71_17015 [Verrucomicrobiota bacterium]
MVLRKLMGIFVITLIVGAASLAMAGVPDVTQCEASRAYAGPERTVVMNVPDGNGKSFTEAVKVGGGDADATITLIVRDGAGVPIANYPFEDCWLESVDGGMVACVGGTTADASTDVDGMTEFQNPLLAGGSSLADTRVIINGNSLINTLPVSYNSPDLNGDGGVNLTDVQIFAGDFFAVGYAFRADLFFDNIVNLSDLPRLAAAIGAGCP